MEKYYSNEPPLLYINNGGKRELNYNVVELTDDDIIALWEEKVDKIEPYEWFADSHKYSYNTVEIGIAQWTYEGIVNAIIRDKYSIDAMEAITNNMAAINAVFMQTLVSEGIVAATKYLKDSINDENTANFKEMQEWRKMAKEVAKSIIKQ